MTAKAEAVVAKGVPHPAGKEAPHPAVRKVPHPAVNLEVAVHLAGISELPHLKRLEVAHSYTTWYLVNLP